MSRRIQLMAGAAIAAISLTSAGSALAARYQVTAGRPGFAALAASFLSVRTGFVLGGMNCAHGRSCPAGLAATTDAGAHWQVRSLPRRIRLAEVNQVLFATSRIGWLAGRSFWATSDGGAHWRRIKPAFHVLGLTAAGSRAYAVLARASGGYGQLFTSKVGTNSWTAVRGVNG